jgi:hypothetical protein
VIEEKILLRNVKKVKLVETLKQRGYTKFSEFTQIKTTKKHGAKGKKAEGAGGDEE